VNWKSRYFGTKAEITAYGAFLILASLVTLARLTEGFFAWLEVWREPLLLLINAVRLTAEPEMSSGLGIIAALGIIGGIVGVGLLGLAASIAYLLTGLGALRFRTWTRKMAILLVVDVIAWYCFSIWVYGAQKFGVPEYCGTALSLALLVAYAADRSIKAELNRNHRPMGGGPKALLVSYTFVIAVKILSAPVFIGFLYATHGDVMRALNVKPQRVEYELSDSDLIEKLCSKYEVFG
jgi:hypothetical protein